MAEKYSWKAAADSCDALLRAVMDALGIRPDQDPVAEARKIAERIADSTDRGVPGFAEREKWAARAWGFFTRSGREMSDDFRGGYHKGVLDAFRRGAPAERAVADEQEKYFETLRRLDPSDEMARIIEQARKALSTERGAK